MSLLKPTDFEILERILPTLNHYQLLKVTSAATSEEIQAAFHREALIFHPDRYQKLNDQDLSRRAKNIYTKIVEAYRTLSNRQKRSTYDQSLKISSQGTSVDQQGQEDITTFRTRKTNTSSPGYKFLKLAQAALQSGNLQSSKMNINLALNMEPENQEFLQFFKRLDGHIKKGKG